MHEFLDTLWYLTSLYTSLFFIFSLKDFELGPVIPVSGMRYVDS